MTTSVPARFGAILLATALAVGLTAAPASAAVHPPAVVAAAKAKAKLTGTSQLTVPASPSLKYVFSKLPKGKKTYELQRKAPTGGWMRVKTLKKSSGTVTAPQLTVLGAYTYRVVAKHKVKGKTKSIVASKAKTVKAYGTVDLLSICNSAYPSLLSAYYLGYFGASGCDNNNNHGTKIVGGVPFSYLVQNQVQASPATGDLLTSGTTLPTCTSISLQWIAWDSKHSDAPIGSSIFLTQGTATQAVAAAAGTVGSATFNISAGKPLVVAGTTDVLGSTPWIGFNGTAVCYTPTGI